MQIPIPDVKLLVRNPNYDLIQAIGFLALTEEALAGVDNNGTYEETGRIVRPQDYYISFTPSLGGAVVKDTVTMDIKAQIVELFEKYTIYQFLEIITGESYVNITDNNALIRAVQDGLVNVPIYGEVGFANDSDSTLDGYFIRCSVFTRFSFDKAYLDNPSLKPFVLTADTEELKINFRCKNLKKINFKVYSSPDNVFDFVNDTPIKTVSFDVSGKIDPSFSIDMNSIAAPNFNNFTNFTTNTQLNNIINKRKYFAVKITSVVVSSGIEKLESTFASFFNLNKNTDTTKIVELTYNVQTPSVATFTEPLAFPKPPYFLNLINGTRKFFFKLVVDVSGIPLVTTDPPRGIKGILLKYVNNPATNSNMLRYYPLTHPNVKLEMTPFVPAGTNKAWYFYSITDYFKNPKATEPSFKLDIPYAPQIFAYTVNTYFYTSNVPLTLQNVKRYNLVNYLTDNAFGFDAVGNLILKNAGFLRSIPRVSLKFKIEYTAAKPGQAVPPVNAVWTTFNKTYRISIPHVYGNMIDYTATNYSIYEEGSSVPSINIPLKPIFDGLKKGKGEGRWVRIMLIDTYAYSAGTTRPYIDGPVQLGRLLRFV